MRVGWHIDGMTYEQYLNLTEWQRVALLMSVGSMIDKANSPTEDGGGASRPKRLRK